MEGASRAFVGVAATAILAARTCRAQVQVNPLEDVPLIGNLFGGSTDTKHDAWFWVIIGIIAAFFVVLVFFTGWGFYKWKQHKKLLAKTKAVDLEHNVIELPSGKRIPRVPFDDEELMRRTGQKHPAHLPRCASAKF